MIVERVKAPSRKEFYKRYYKTNTPVIFTDAIDSWPAKSLWNPEFFKSEYGDVDIRVEKMQANKDDENFKPAEADFYLKNMERSMLSMRDYINNLDSLSASDTQMYAAEIPIFTLVPELKNHIKDFIYWPKLLRKLSGLNPNLWIGPKDCKTGLHYDFAPNFIVQFSGEKKWVLFPKSQHDLLYLPSDLDMPHFCPIDYDNPDLDKYPKYSKATPVEVIMKPGEMLFLPAGVVHYVSSLSTSISMNFWWVSWRDVASILGQVPFKLIKSLTRETKS